MASLKHSVGYICWRYFYL